MDYESSGRLASTLPESLPPLAVDIDGTLTGTDRALDPRVIPVLRAWPSPLVVATGKSIPYPVALCEFVGIETRVVAENGGVVVPDRTSDMLFVGKREAANAVAREYQERGHSLGWGGADLVNRWRETELAVSRESPLEPLEELAEKHGLTVVDTGFAYHVHASDIDKGIGLSVFADELELDTDSIVYVGDSANDLPGFEVAGQAVAVANADESVQQAADHVTAESYGSGFLEAIEWIVEQTA